MLVRRNSHRWRFGIFKRLTDATYFLARQAVQLRKERVYSPKADQQPIVARGAPNANVNTKIKDSEEKAKKLQFGRKN